MPLGINRARRTFNYYAYYKCPLLNGMLFLRKKKRAMHSSAMFRDGDQIPDAG
jgi:hypothetical protein